MPRGDWSLEVCVRNLETGRKVKGVGHGKPLLCFSLPFKVMKCESKKKTWKVRIRRDEGELFTITEHTRVCSLHFTADDYRATLGGLKVLKDDAVPSVFPWKTPAHQRLSKTSSRGMGKGEEKTLCSPCQEKDRETERLTELLKEKDDEIKVLKSNLIFVFP